MKQCNYCKAAPSPTCVGKGHQISDVERFQTDQEIQNPVLGEIPKPNQLEVFCGKGCQGHPIDRCG